MTNEHLISQTLQTYIYVIPNAHKLPNLLSALLVSVYFLFNYIFI